MSASESKLNATPPKKIITYINALTKDGAPVIQLKADKTRDFDVKEEFVPTSQKSRVLESLSDVGLENMGEIDAVVMAEIEALIEQNPEDLEQQLTSLIEKEFRKLL